MKFWSLLKYASRLRQSQNRDKIRNIINESFHLENFYSVGLHSGDVLQGNISSLNISSSNFTLKENSIKAQTREGSASYFELTAKDYHSFIGNRAVTCEVEQCWKEMIDAVNFKQPVLLTGPNGCGKSTTCLLYTSDAADE